MTCSPSRCPHAGLLDVRKMDDFEVEKVEGLPGLHKVLKTLGNPIPKRRAPCPGSPGGRKTSCSTSRSHLRDLSTSRFLTKTGAKNTCMKPPQKMLEIAIKKDKEILENPEAEVEKLHAALLDVCRRRRRTRKSRKTQSRRDQNPAQKGRHFPPPEKIAESPGLPAQPARVVFWTVVRARRPRKPAGLAPPSRRLRMLGFV